MFKSKKLKKPLIVILSVVLGIIFICVAAVVGCRLIADSLIYHYVDLSGKVRYGSTYDSGGTMGEGLKYPFFGNPLTVSEETGSTYHFPLGAGEKNLYVYDAINYPIYSWMNYMRTRYKNDVAVDYTVEMGSEYITVNFFGTLTENDEVIPIEQRFVISIKNASPDNLPTWENEDEISEGFKGYLAYLDDNTKVPDWLEKLNA